MLTNTHTHTHTHTHTPPVAAAASAAPTTPPAAASARRWCGGIPPSAVPLNDTGAVMPLGSSFTALAAKWPTVSAALYCSSSSVDRARASRSRACVEKWRCKNKSEHKWCATAIEHTAGNVSRKQPLSHENHYLTRSFDQETLSHTHTHTHTHTPLSHLPQPPCRYGSKCNKQSTGCKFAHPTVVATVKVPADVMALLCVDTSGSMAGARIQAATAGLQTLVRALKPRDVLALYKFDTTVDVLHKFARNQAIDWPRLFAALDAAPRGQTAFHDAVMQALDALATYAKPKHDARQLRCIVALTDGDDNQSAHTLDAVIRRLHTTTIANFHFILIGVGVAQSKYAALFTPDKPNLHFIDVATATADAIRAAYGTVTKRIYGLQQKLLVRNTTTTTTTTTTATTTATTAASSSSSSTSTAAAPAPAAAAPRLYRRRVVVIADAHAAAQQQQQQQQQRR